MTAPIQRMTLCEVVSTAEAALAFCDADGTIVCLSPPGCALLESVGLDLSSSQRQLPSCLRDKLRAARAGSIVEWTPEGPLKPIYVGEHPLGSGHTLVAFHQRGGYDDLAQRIYHSTQQLMARLIASTAHDLRSPLASVSFTAGVLSKRWRELAPDKVQQLLSEICEGCHQQERTIRDLVEHSAATQPMAVELGELFRHLASMLRPMFRLGDNWLHVSIAEPLVVKGPPLTLEHIFVNLLHNATEAASHPVKVSVRAAVSATDPGWVRLFVSDDGPGIPLEVRHRIFDPLFTTKPTGTGLGLSLAREAARELGGDLVLDQSSVQGTTFIVTMPLAPGAEAAR